VADQPAIRLDHLTKRYGAHRGIEDVTLDVHPGEVLGFLGPNGAGKTTAIRCLVGFLRPTSGSATVLGFDAERQSVEVRRRVGYLPGDPSLYGSRTGHDLLRIAGEARGAPVAPLAERLVSLLEAPMDRPVRKLSRGMRQKVAVVLALAHDPEVALLDEPTSGLDPLGQRALLEFLDERANAGRTILLSSHVLSEVEEICDRVAILREGRLTALDTVESLRGRKYREVSIAYEGEPPPLAGLDDIDVIWQHEGRMRFRVRAEPAQLLQALSHASITDVTITEPSLEEVFLDYYRAEAKA
jgi:ABC-2 type transport system ATP-binding protein